MPKHLCSKLVSISSLVLQKLHRPEISRTNPISLATLFLRVLVDGESTSHLSVVRMNPPSLQSLESEPTH
ncbi:hypothetical protein D3C72_1331870 [compost metagenome]